MAETTTISKNDNNTNSIVLTEKGVFIDGTYYSQKEFKILLNSAVQNVMLMNNQLAANALAMD